MLHFDGETFKGVESQRKVLKGLSLKLTNNFVMIRQVTEKDSCKMMTQFSILNDSDTNCETNLLTYP